MSKAKIDSFISQVHDFYCENEDQPEALLDAEIGYRGGGIKIDASLLIDFIDDDDINTTCGTYQNYLGGGMLGAVCSGSNFSKDDLTKQGQKDYIYLMECLKKLHHSLTNHVYEWENQTYEQNQKMSISAY
jgi:hypothetical protein